MKRSEELLDLARQLAKADAAFFAKKGPGPGNKATNAFMRQLRERALAKFGADYSEQRICGSSALAVDFYFPRDGTVVEIALGLHNPKTEFEHDILKALMAKETGSKVNSLFFISKPGAIKKCSQPGRRAMIEWAKRKHGLRVEIFELHNNPA